MAPGSVLCCGDVPVRSSAGGGCGELSRRQGISLSVIYFSFAITDIDIFTILQYML